MTERKPPGISFESFVDKQIREATERGDFDDLPGAGQPLRDAQQPYDEQWWLKRKLRDEGVAQLPPTLALRKEAEEALAEAARAPSEEAVRGIVADINDKIRDALRRPMDGPPLRLRPHDPEEVVRDWRERRSERG
jgi:hypothetical protein